MQLLNNTQADQTAALLFEEVPERARLLTRLLNQAEIPARLVMGLHLEGARRRQSLTPMVETYTDQGWVLFHPVTGEHGGPDKLLLWNRGGQWLLGVTGVHGCRVNFTV